MAAAAESEELSLHHGKVAMVEASRAELKVGFKAVAQLPYKLAEQVGDRQPQAYLLSGEVLPAVLQTSAQ